MTKRASKPELYNRYRQVLTRMIYAPEPYWSMISWISEEFGIGEAQAKNYFTEARKILKEGQEQSYIETMSEAQSFWKEMIKDAYLDGDKEIAITARKELSKLAGHYIERQHVDLTANIKFEFDDE